MIILIISKYLLRIYVVWFKNKTLYKKCFLLTLYNDSKRGYRLESIVEF